MKNKSFKNILKKKLVISFITCAMLLSGLSILPTASAADPVYVDDNFTPSTPGWGVDHFASIQAGINAVNVGGIVNVAAGTYYENLASWKNMEIIKSLSLIGAGSGSTIVQLDKQNGVEIRSTSLTVLIQGITFTKLPTNTFAADYNLKIAESSSTFTSLVLRDVEVAYANHPNVNLGANGIFNQLIIENCNFHHAGTWGLLSQGQLPNGMTVTNSHFDYNGQYQSGYGIGFDLTSYAGSSNIIVTGGTFNHNTAKGINLLLTSSATFNNIEANYNGEGVCLWEWSGTSQNLIFNNPTLISNSIDGFLIGAETGCTVTGVTINEGTLQNNARGGLFIYNMGGTLKNIQITHANIIGNYWGVYTNTLPVTYAKCNWWGQINGPSGVGPGTGDRVSSNVIYCPWLDAVWPTGDCIGGARCWNINTGEYFCSIQKAIDDSDTLDGHTIEAFEGTHPGNIIVYKEVTIVSRSGAASTIIDANAIDYSLYQNDLGCGIGYTWAQTYDPGLLKNGFMIWNDSVTIDGFTIINAVWPTQYNRGIGILVGSIWSTYVGFNPWNIEYYSDQWCGDAGWKPARPTGVTIKNNYIDGASDGIYVWSSNGTTIEYNTIVNSVAVGGAGIQCYEGGTDNIIRYNIIDNCDGAGISVGGYWPAGLLDISNTKIYNNNISNCSIGIQFYNMDGSGTAAYYNIIINNSIGIRVGDAGGAVAGIAYCNAIVGNTVGVQNDAPDGTFNAECNWWGDFSGPNGEGPGTGDSVSINVDYDPWIGGTIDADGPYQSMSDGCISFNGTADVSDCCNEVFTYSWNFGDGNTGSGLDPVYCYASGGSYTVSLIVNISFLGFTDTAIDITQVTAFVCPPDDNTPVIDLMIPEPNTQVSGTTEIYWLAYIPANELSTDFYVDLYYSPDGTTWRTIAKGLQNQFPDDPVHGNYMWDTTQLSDGDYWIKGEAWTLDRSSFNSDMLTATVYVYNGNLGGMVSDIEIIDVSTNSKKWVKDTDAVTVSAGITGATELNRNDIIADLTCLGGGAAVPVDEFDGFVATWNLNGVVCSPSNGPITITVMVLAEDGGSKTCTIVADNIKPESSLVKPVNGLYLFGAKLLPLTKTIILGSATVQISTQDATSGVQKAELYLNDNLIGETLSAPYIISLNKQYKGDAELMVQVYDNAGNIEEIIQPVTIYNFLGN